MSDASSSSNTKTNRAVSMEQKYNAKVARWPSLEEPWTIHRVPHSIKAVDKDAYQPKMLSIGPYHRSNTSLKAMEDHKWRYMQAILSRDPSMDLSDYLEEMKELEVKARSFYSEKIEIESDEFVEMMLLDGCFIVELFFHVKDRNATAEIDDPIYSTKWILPIIRLDMLLLENQLPFFVVERLFQLVPKSNTSSLVELALRFFEHLIPMMKNIPSVNSIPHSMESIHHLLHLYHQHLLPTPPKSDLFDQGGNTFLHINMADRQSPRETPSVNSIPGSMSSIRRLSHRDHQCLFPTPPKSDPSDQGGNTSLAMKMGNRLSLHPQCILSASEILHYLGLKKKKNASSILEVKLKGACLKIPTLCINHSTNSLFRNLIAWEHCYPKCGTQFTSYVVLMNCLIDSPNDVEVLRARNIIEYWLGNNEKVAVLFNQMCMGIDLDDSFLSDVLKQLVRTKESKSRIWHYNLKRNLLDDKPSKLLAIQLTFISLCVTATQSLLQALISFLESRGQ